MNNKLLAVLLVLALLACLLPATAIAAPESQVLTAPEESAETEVLPAEEPGEEVTPSGEDALPAEEAPVIPEQTGEAAADAAALAEQIQPDGPVADLIPAAEDGRDPASDTPAAVTVSEGEIVYSYEGMVVYNNGGTVYNNNAVVYNTGGLVYSNGGKVYNNGGVVYANSGTVYNNDGTVYNNEAEVFGPVGAEDEPDGGGRVLGYYELKLANYYEPYIMLEGVTTEPGSEKMIISEDTVCRVRPYPGFLIVDADTDVGVISRDEDGGIMLTDVTADTVLTLIIQPEAPAFNLQSGAYAEPQTVEISGPAGCEIFYSTDGTVPNPWNALYYDAPFEVDESTVISAIAVAKGTYPSISAQLTLSFLDITAPELQPESEGYTKPLAAAIRVENRSLVPVEILSVSLTGADADAFILSYSAGRTISAGKTNDSTWTVRPAEGLPAGDYEAALSFSLDSGETVEVPVQFSVLPADSASA